MTHPLSCHPTVRAGVGRTSAALLVLAVVVLYFFDPATAGFYPPCLFKTVLGMGCPGCGSLRPPLVPG